jgi:hypothetical protein
MAPSFSMSPSSKTSALVLALTIALSAHSVAAFYLPGVAPTDYELGEAMRVKVPVPVPALPPLPRPCPFLCASAPALRETDPPCTPP